jgi:hypothetical protein
LIARFCTQRIGLRGLRSLRTGSGERDAALAKVD